MMKIEVDNMFYRTATKEGGWLSLQTSAAGGYERQIEDGKIRHLYYISGADGMVAICKKEDNNKQFYYVHKDHLGSPHVITDENKEVQARYYYDVWGHRYFVNKENGSELSGQNDLSWMQRGFTGHEHIKELDMINMNGRMFDPLLGRFLSPDPYVQSPDRTKNFNRHAYAMNNPLVFEDPSGEFILTVLCAVIPGAQPLLPFAIAADIGGVVNTASNWKDITNYSDNFWQGLGRGSLYYTAGGLNGGLSMTGFGGAVGGGAIQSGMNAAIQDESLDEIWKEAGIGAFSNAVGFGVGKGTTKIISKGLDALGVENMIAKEMISKGVGGATGAYSHNVSNYKVRGAKWKQSFKVSFDWSIPAAAIAGAAKGYFDATRPPKTSGKRYYDGHRESYYSDRVAPPEIPESNLNLNLSQPKIMPPLKVFGHWEFRRIWDDIHGWRWEKVWVEN